MAHKQWYEKVAEMDSQSEREAFISGMFGMRPRERQPMFAWLIAGYAAGKASSLAKKQKK